MLDTTALRPEPPDEMPAGAEFLVTVRVTAEPGQSAQVAQQIAETLRRALIVSPGNALELVPMPRDANAVLTRRAELRIDVPYRIVRLGGAEVELTRLEFDLLLYLARDPGRVFARETLLMDVWHAPEPSRTRTVDVHIRRLRGKLGRHGDMIGTVRRVGYRFEPDADIAVVE